MPATIYSLVEKWRGEAESCDQTGMEQDAKCGACLLESADQLEALLREWDEHWRGEIANGTRACKECLKTRARNRWRRLHGNAA
jgi:hypothetical protein